MPTIKIQFTLFSAFYSPLISTMSGGFLEEEGLDYEWSVSPPGKSAIEAVVAGDVHVCQTALYACHKAGIDFAKIKAINPGGAADMDKAFREGQGQYIQQQGPFPQQLEKDGVGHIVAQVGPQIGPNGFSSLAATPEWLETDMARAFTRAYRKTRAYMNDTPAAEIARAEKPFFPNIDQDVLTDCIATYQKLGCWTPHLEITPEAFDVTQDVFEHFGTLKTRYRWDQVCCLPPEV